MIYKYIHFVYVFRVLYLLRSGTRNDEAVKYKG